DDLVDPSLRQQDGRRRHQGEGPRARPPQRRSPDGRPRRKAERPIFRREKARRRSPLLDGHHRLSLLRRREVSIARAGREAEGDRARLASAAHRMDQEAQDEPLGSTRKASAALKRPTLSASEKAEAAEPASASACWTAPFR